MNLQQLLDYYAADYSRFYELPESVQYEIAVAYLKEEKAELDPFADKAGLAVWNQMSDESMSDEERGYLWRRTIIEYKPVRELFEEAREKAESAVLVTA